MPFDLFSRHYTHKAYKLYEQLGVYTELEMVEEE